MGDASKTGRDTSTRHALQVGGLLVEVLHSLRFYAGAGYSGGDCSADNLERIQQWCSPDCLRLKASSSDLTAGHRPCEKCPLQADRRHMLIGAGPARARLMFVLGAPSLTADTEGTPYAGEAGQLLEKIVTAMKLTTNNVYVTHSVKCRPPEGRKPTSGEMRCCLPLLESEINAIAPDVICSLGVTATRTLLGSRESLERLRGQFYEKYGCRIMPTWQPEDMIDDPEKKRPVWEDLRKVMRCLDIT